MADTLEVKKARLDNWRAGWKVGAINGSKRDDTASDRTAYLAGYECGKMARIAADKAALKDVGFTPEEIEALVLR